MKYIFFSIIILVTALPAIYSASRFCSNLSFITWIKWVVIPVYIILFLSLLASLIAGQAAGARLESILLSAGFSFLVATIYFSFFFIAYDLIVLIIKVSGLYKLIPDSGLRVAGELFTVAVLITTAALMVWGHHRFNNPVVTAMEIDLGRGRPSEELNVVIASDLHLGNNIGRADLERFVQLINRSEADIVLLAGDITDNRLKPLISQNMNKLLSAITAKFGVYAVPGNHEFYGGEKQEIIEFLRSAGITVLADSTVLTAGGKVIIAGRDDRTNKDRMPLDILLSKVDRNKPVILMDHQPVNLNEVESAGIDISVSGHTHNGQFWPGNLIVKWMYDHGYGYMKKSRTHFIVSSGLGLWGPKYRIGTVSEIVSVKLKL